MRWWNAESGGRLRRGEKEEAQKGSKCVSERRNSQKRREQQRTDEEDVRGGGPTEEVEVSSEGGIRGVSRTSLAEKETDKATEDKLDSNDDSEKPRRVDTSETNPNEVQANDTTEETKRNDHCS